jgi:molybdenum-dependent DNA-binding transcriptional regulator ModE
MLPAGEYMSRNRYYKEIRFEHFRTFRQVARLRSFAAAAKAIGLSRPTVWQQIDALESEFGVKLRLISRTGPAKQYGPGPT